MAENDMNRRQFGKRAAVASAAGSLAILGGAGSAEDAADETGEHRPAVAEPIPPNQIPVELLLLEVIRQRHPNRELNHHFLDEIRRDIRGELNRARAIREVPLTNADEPAAIFAAYRDQGGRDAS